MGYLEDIWTIENFSCWNRKIHGNEIISPDFIVLKKSFSMHLYPKGVSGRGELLVLEFQGHPPFDISGTLSFIDSGGYVFFTENIRVRENEYSCVEIDEILLKFEEIATSIRENEDLHNDQLTLKIKWDIYPDHQEERYMHSAICLHDVSMKISSELFYNYTSMNTDIMTISILGPPSEDSKTTDIKLHCHIDESDVSKIQLMFTPVGLQKCTMIYTRMSLFNKDDIEIRSEGKDHLFYGDEQWTFSDSLTRDHSKEEEFSLFLRIKIIPGNKFNKHQYTYSIAYPNQIDVMPARSFKHRTLKTSNGVLGSSVDVLSKDFTTLYQNRDFSDLTLKCGDVTFPAHKVILSARSPVFKTMLSSDMKESSSGRVDITDIDPSTLGHFLAFLYTGEVEGIQAESCALNLYYAADKYQVPSLKRECASVLSSIISVSNVCDILCLAEKHQDVVLATASRDFVLNHYNEVLKSNEWDSFVCREPLLASKTLTQLGRDDKIGKLSVL